MAEDFLLVLRWWGVLFLFGAAAFPLTKQLFRGWWDGGYLFSKAVGMAVVGWIVYVLGTLRILPFSLVSITVALWIVIGVGAFLLKGKNIYKEHRVKRVILYFFEELFFFGALLFWTWIKAHEPSIRGLEKFMDFGFMKSILESSYFPANDMWFAGHTINYYYFGHIVTAVLTKFSGIDLTITFNLMLATIFALTLTMSFSIGKQICQLGHMRKIGQIAGGFLTAFLVTLSGNMQTLYAFTKGYTGDNVKPFWQLWWTPKDIAGLGQVWEKIGEGLNRYWYANATRFIPFTIHEFPSYSFVVSDIHGHVLSLPFVLLAIGLLIQLFNKGDVFSSSRTPIRDPSVAQNGFRVTHSLRSMQVPGITQVVFYGFLVGVLLMTNALDGPIYLGLFIVVLGISNIQYPISKWKYISGQIVVVLITAVVTSLPFLFHFKSFVNGIAINCPPGFLANTKIGPFLFEEVAKCQHSPLWMLLILWGFFIFCGVWLIIKVKSQKLKVKSEVDRLLLVFFFFSLALIIFPEFFYFKDIYPMHFRSNTMFKLGYQAFILFSIVAGYTITSYVWKRKSDDGIEAAEMKHRVSRKGRLLFVVILLPMLFLVSIFPIFSVRSYFNGLKVYRGIGGLQWLKDEYPDDWAGIEWIQSQKSKVKSQKSDKYVLVEADGDSYTDYNRFSVFTGIPTVVGWAVHEWLWRGGYDVVAPRREEVAKIYESTDLAQTGNILKKYHVGMVVVGSLERTKYKNLQEWKFASLGRKVFQSKETVLYEIGGEIE